MADPARRFGLACTVGGGLALGAFVAFLSSGPGSFFGAEPSGLGWFYDIQARALFDGRWDAPSRYFLENITIDDRNYMYFGPWPALLRMPVLLLTDRLDGGLTRLSLLLGALTLLVAVGRLLWQVRGLTGRVEAPSRRELVAAGAFVFLVGCGTSVVFLSAAGWVYDEAILWGTAWALWTLHFGIAHLRAASPSTLLLSGAATTLAVLSRIGSGALGITLLGGLFVVQLLGAVRRPVPARWGARLAALGGIDRAATRSPWLTGAVTVVPLLVHMSINWAKFHTFLSVPFDKQDDILRIAPVRARVLADNGSDLVAFDQIPTNVVHYFRPDGASFDRLFPFFDFTDRLANIGDVARDPEGPTASMTVTTTLLLALAVVGLAAVLLPRVARRAHHDDRRVLRLPTLAALLVFGPTVIVPAASERYKVDLVPFLVVTGAVGVYALARLLGAATTRRRVLVGVALVLFAWNVLANLTLTLQFQRAYQPVVSSAARADYLADRIAWTERLGVDPRVDHVEWDGVDIARRPPVGSVGQFLVVDRCAELLLSNGWAWLELDLPDPPAACRSLGLPVGRPPA